MIEIERKFLVLSEEFKTLAFQKTSITQGFLNRDPERTVRVRLKGNSGVLTVKGKSSKNGMSRFEWEQNIEKEDAESLLSFCEKELVKKIRHEVKVGTHIFEIDEFLANNKGLIIAEIELNHENENFTKPLWLGKEVTGDIKYYNSQLSKQPYNTWNT